MSLSNQHWLKIGVVLLSTFVSVFSAGCNDKPEPPWLNKHLAQASPRGTYEATFYSYGKGGDGFLGATVSTTAYVNVRRREEPFDADKGKVFAMRNGSRLRLVWKDERHLRIDYTSSATVDKKQDRLCDVFITFKPVPQSTLPLRP